MKQWEIIFDNFHFTEKEKDFIKDTSEYNREIIYKHFLRACSALRLGLDSAQHERLTAQITLINLMDGKEVVEESTEIEEGFSMQERKPLTIEEVEKIKEEASREYEEELNKRVPFKKVDEVEIGDICTAEHLVSEEVYNVNSYEAVNCMPKGCKEKSTDKYPNKFHKLFVKEGGIVPPAAAEEIVKSSKVILPGGIATVADSAVFNGVPISDRYRYVVARQQLFKERKAGEGVEGRFNSLEDRLNCMEDELLTTQLALTEYVENLAEAHREDMDEKYEELTEYCRYFDDIQKEDLVKEIGKLKKALGIVSAAFGAYALINFLFRK